MRLFRNLQFRVQSLVVLVIVLTALSFGPAYAVESDIAADHGAVDAAIELSVEEAHDAGHGDPHHAEVEGLPQLDFTTYSSQIFWMFISFGILYLFFAKKTLPEVSGVLESRREKIESDLDNAQRLKEDAYEAQAAYEESLSEAREKASALFKDTEETIKTLTADKNEAFKKKAAKKIEDTEKSVLAAKDAVLTDTHAIAAEIASIAAQKIVGVSTDINKAKSLVETIGKKAA